MNNGLAKGLLKAGLISKEAFEQAERQKETKRQRDAESSSRSRAVTHRNQMDEKTVRETNVLGFAQPSLLERN